jgi:DinB superfamily
MADATLGTQLSVLVDRMLQQCSAGAEGLSVDQLCDSADGKTNSMGFDLWHVARTVDNIIHFVFEREKPVWLVLNLNEKWGLPKVDQGTGMDEAMAHALKFPEASELAKYSEAVRTAVVPKIEGMSDEYLSEIVKIVPFGDISRMQAIMQVLVSHGNGHLGRVDHARNLLGAKGLGF